MAARDGAARVRGMVAFVSAASYRLVWSKLSATSPGCASGNK
jgi:hypothetical protein